MNFLEKMAQKIKETSEEIVEESSKNRAQRRAKKPSVFRERAQRILSWKNQKSICGVQISGSRPPHPTKAQKKMRRKMQQESRRINRRK